MSSQLDIPWATGELRDFLHATEVVPTLPKFRTYQAATTQRASESEVAGRAYIVEQILDRVTPDWRNIPDPRNEDVKAAFRWEHLRLCASRGLVALERSQELNRKLGDGAPQISTSSLHPWVWSGAKALWDSGHYRSAVEDAAKKVNAETQNKLGRRDVSETALFNQAFTLDVATAGKPLLRRMPPDASDTYKSMQCGAMVLAEGIYAGIRNPITHSDPTDLDQQTALEYLAALSVLARWVDKATVEQAQ